LIFENFLTENKEDFCNLINSTIKDTNKFGKENDLYIVKRETLKVRILNDLRLADD